MKILVINDTDELIGGAAVIANTQIYLLREAGYEVFSFCFGKDFWQDDHNLRLPITNQWWLRKILKLTFHPVVYRRLRSFIRIIHPDVIVIHNNAIYTLSVLWACRGYPTIQVVHDFYLLCPTTWGVQKRTGKVCAGGIGLKCAKQSCVSWWSLLIFHWPFFLMRSIVLRKVISIYAAPSQVLVDYLRRFGYRVELLRNPVPQPEMAPLTTDSESTSLRAYTDAKYILYVGVINENKGLHVLIKAFQKVRHEYPWLKLKIAGEGPQKRKMEILAKRLKLADNVEFLGPVPHTFVSTLYKHALATVVPSVGQENFPTVITEAMSYGCPVIGSEIGGITELIGDNERGLLFKPGDAEDLADKISLLIREPTLRNKISQQAKQYVQNALGSQVYLQKFSEIVSQILSKRCI